MLSQPWNIDSSIEISILINFAGSKLPDTQGTPPAMVGGLPVGGGSSPQPAFIYRGVWIPLLVTLPQGQTRPV